MVMIANIISENISPYYGNCGFNVWGCAKMCTSVDIFICGQWTVHCSDIFSGRAVLDLKKIDDV